MVRRGGSDNFRASNFRNDEKNENFQLGWCPPRQTLTSAMSSIWLVAKTNQAWNIRNEFNLVGRKDQPSLELLL